MNTVQKDIYNIETLGKLTGLNRRTIRYYIQRGILQRPYGGGRGHYYTREHLKRIREIQRLRKQGVPIEKMREIFSTSPSVSGSGHRKIQSTIPIEETLWHRITVKDGVEISFREGALSDDEKEKILSLLTSIL